MKNGLNKRKIKIAAVCMLVVLVCGGYILYKPKLINADRPFIDLAGTVGKSIGDAQKAYSVDTATPTLAPNPTDAAKPTPVPTMEPIKPVLPTPIPENQVVISIADKDIKVNNSVCVSLADRLSWMVKDDTQVVLVDDYAELKTYRNALRILKELGITDYVTERID